MHLIEFEGKRPTVHPEAFVAELWVAGNPSYYVELAQRHRLGARRAAGS